MNRDDIIGQDKILDEIDDLIANKKFPKFVLFYGHRGTGKRMITQYIAEQLGANIVRPEDDKITVEYIRNIIEQAYKQTSPTIYLVPEIDLNTVSAEAKNSLLKVTEEVPNNAYFVITALKNERVLPTIKSRAYSFWMGFYTQGVLKAVAFDHNIELDEELFSIAKTPGDVINMGNMIQEQKDLVKFVENVLDNIGETSGSNAFRIAEKIAFTVDDTGFSLENFYKVFKEACMKKTKDMSTPKRDMYYRFITITSNYESKIHYIRSLNKKALFDLWILDIRNTYLTYNK